MPTEYCDAARTREALAWQTDFDGLDVMPSFPEN
jgi:hypothetical protein